jgi:aminoglycoside phosphotransferase (APT) family kinase protein
MDMLKQPLAAYLKHRFGPSTELVEELKFPRGSSRETWFVQYRTKPGAVIDKIVFRTDFPSGSTIPSSLAQEYFMYERLGRTKVPVARVLWWEEDAGWAARPFYVREHIEGSWEIPHYRDPDPVYDALRIEISKEHMRNLALVHTVDWRSLGLDKRLPAPANVQSAALAYIEEIEKTMKSLGGEPVPLFVAGAAWLKGQAPVAPCLSLCKGTNGMGEEVFRDGKIVAMSDWEEAAIGDPAADIAFAQEFVSDVVHDGKTLWSLAHALDYYHSQSGIRITPEAVGFYRKLQSFKMMMYTQSAAMGTRSTPDAHIRQAWTGTEVAHVGKRIMAAALGLGPPIPGSRFLELNLTME